MNATFGAGQSIEDLASNRWALFVLMTYYNNTEVESLTEFRSQKRIAEKAASDMRKLEKEEDKQLRRKARMDSIATNGHLNDEAKALGEKKCTKNSTRWQAH